LKYRDRDNSEKTPLCIHRAPLGTHERFHRFFNRTLRREFSAVACSGPGADSHDWRRRKSCLLTAEAILAELRGNFRPGRRRISATIKFNGKISAGRRKAKVHTMLVIGPGLGIRKRQRADPRQKGI